MAEASVSSIIAQLRIVDQGSWDLGMADFSSNDLERAREWAIRHDGSLLVLIEDELAFRRIP